MAALTSPADHNVKTRSNPNEQDGTSGGGVGVAEMRERKMKGMGLPSPQVCLAAVPLLPRQLAAIAVADGLILFP